MPSTHTYALLEVPAVVYAAVKALLTRAGYDHAFQPDGAIDMHGIALTKQPGARGVTTNEGMVEVGTILSSKHGHGRVEMQIGAEVAQWDIADAKKVAGMLTEAIEAAISDELIFKFLTERVHLPAEKAASLLVEFRELRQGSKGTVNPS
jgi:hypothetical protein